MDYEQQSIISRFLAPLPENLQQTPLSSLTGLVLGWGYMDRMHRQRKSPCLSFDMYISNHFLNRIFFSSPHPMPLFFTCYSSPFYWGSVCVFTSSIYTKVDTSNVALICFRLAFSSLLVAVLVKTFMFQTYTRWFIATLLRNFLQILNSWIMTVSTAVLYWKWTSFFFLFMLSVTEGLVLD